MKAAPGPEAPRRWDLRSVKVAGWSWGNCTDVAEGHRTQPSGLPPAMDYCIGWGGEADEGF